MSMTRPERVMMGIVGALLLGFLFWGIPSFIKKSDADQAINQAVSRMARVVDQDNPASLAIACGNTSDKIACTVTDADHFLITYFDSRDARVPFAVKKVWVEKYAGHPRLFSNPIEYK